MRKLREELEFEKLKSKNLERKLFEANDKIRDFERAKEEAELEK